MLEPNHHYRILHILLSMGETSSPYNEHCLPAAESGKVSICTFFKPTVNPNPGFTVYAGDGTILGFYRGLKAALESQVFDIIHAHSVHVATLYFLGKVFIKSNQTGKSIYTFHSSFPNYKFTNRLLLLFPVLFSRRVVCCSNASLLSLPKFIKHLGGDRFCVVQNGIDLERIDQVAKLSMRKRADSAIRIISVGRLIAVKNPMQLSQAYVRLADPNTQLIYIGEGDLRWNILAVVRENHLEDRIILTGLVPRTAVYEHLNNADIFVSTSKVEGLPIAVLEAMACRLPVILSDIPPHREIADGVDFIPLISPDDTEGFVKEIGRIRGMSPEERAELGEKCRVHVENKFSLQVMRSGYQAVYASEVLS